MSCDLCCVSQATFFSGLSPSAALDVYRSFDRARRRFVTSTNLHALFLLCPVDVGIELDWAMLWEVFTSWDDDHPAKIVANAVSVALPSTSVGLIYIGFSIDVRVALLLHRRDIVCRLLRSKDDMKSKALKGRVTSGHRDFFLRERQPSFRIQIQDAFHLVLFNCVC